MPVRVFVSTEDSADARARRIIEGLREAGLQVTCSPLNPAVGHDPRWRGWYEEAMALLPMDPKAACHELGRPGGTAVA